MQLRCTDTETPYLQPSGSYPNKSKYVRVEVIKPAPDYLDENGNTTTASMQSMPGNGSGSFGGTFNSGSSGYVGFDAHGNQQGGSFNTLPVNEGCTRFVRIYGLKFIR